MTFHYKCTSSKTSLYTCCNEIQFEWACAYCYEPMGCMYCAFDMNVKHDCLQDQRHAQDHA